MPEPPVLRIGIDGRELAGAPTGVGRYLAELLTRWAARADAPRRELVVYAPEPALREAPGALAGLPRDGLRIEAVAGRGDTWWEQTRLARAVRRDRLDALFAPAYTAPLLAGVPTVLAVHDVSFLVHPEWFPWPNRLKRRWLTRAAARRAARILTFTRVVRSELAEQVGVPADRIEVIPHGVTRPANPDAVGADERDPLVLFAGSIFNRRHVLDLVRAFAAVAARHPDARLIIAGENRTYPREDPAALAAGLGLGGRVECRDYVSDAELASLYRRARVFAFFSEYEGFGFTPLEALAAGVPAVVYDTPVAREVYGPAAVYVRCGDLTGAAGALERLLVDPASRAAVLARAPEVLERYSWSRAAEATLRVIEGVARRRPAGLERDV